ncbi:hypothetical protein [Rhodoblastus sp.]|uniref:hypothetical protein n=1 Tax=Rhodoblastus sp. TaxID=1962975 RepID=UPI003F978306
MQNHTPSGEGDGPVNDSLLETVIAAHYLVLQMRMLTSSGQFIGQVETELMADALSRWAQVAGTKWRDANREAAGSATDGGKPSPPRS